MTLDDCYDIARRVALSMPPSDFGSTRAIKAFGETLMAEIVREREACAKIVHDRLGADGYGVAKLIRARSNPST